MIDRDIKIGARVTCSDTLGYDDFSIVIDKLDDTILVENQAPTLISLLIIILLLY
jgi:hypothetical protein